MDYTFPEYTVPKYTVLEYTLPEYTVPGYTVLKYTIPEYTVPECTVPENKVPGYTVPVYKRQTMKYRLAGLDYRYCYNTGRLDKALSGPTSITLRCTPLSSMGSSYIQPVLLAAGNLPP